MRIRAYGRVRYSHRRGLRECRKSPSTRRSHAKKLQILHDAKPSGSGGSRTHRRNISPFGIHDLRLYLRLRRTSGSGASRKGKVHNSPFEQNPSVFKRAFAYHPQSGVSLPGALGRKNKLGPGSKFAHVRKFRVCALPPHHPLAGSDAWSYPSIRVRLIDTPY